MRINEDFFDDIDIDDVTEQPEDEHNGLLDHSIYLTGTTLFLYIDRKEPESKVKKHIMYFTHALQMVLDNAPIISNYEIYTVTKNLERIQKCPSFDNIVDLNIKKYYKDAQEFHNKYTATGTEPELGDEWFIPYNIEVRIQFNENNLRTGKHFGQFNKLIMNLVRSLDSNKFMGLYIQVDDTVVFKSYNKEGLVNIKTVYVEIFKTSPDFSMKALSNAPDYSYTGPAILSRKSSKTIIEFKFGDFLFCTPDGELCSQSKIKRIKNKPIALFLGSNIDQDGVYGLFMGITELSLRKPDTGELYGPGILLTKSRYRNTSKVKNLPDTTEYNGIKNTEILYKFAMDEINDSGQFDIHWNQGVLSNDKEIGYFPALSAIYRYRTAGTSRGQWFIPSINELLMLSTKRNKINKAFDKLYDLWHPLMHSLSVSNYMSSTINDDPYSSKKYAYVDYSEPKEIKWTSTDNDMQIVPFLKVRNKK